MTTPGKKSRGIMAKNIMHEGELVRAMWIPESHRTIKDTDPVKIQAAIDKRERRKQKRLVK